MAVKFTKHLSIFIYLIPIAVFLAYIFSTVWMTHNGTVKRMFDETKWGAVSMKNLTAKLEGELRRGIYRKFDYINLNGLIARLEGLHNLNGVQRLRSGLLANLPRTSPFNPLQQARRLIQLKKFLDERGISFHVVVVPSKNAIYDATFAKGYGHDYSRLNHVLFVEYLKKADINTLDMDKVFKDEGWSSKQVFYKTDHHWMPEAALLTTKKSLEMLAQIGVIDFDEKLLDKDNFKIHTLRKFFNGTEGRRTGIHFVGLDDYTAFRPLPGKEIPYAELQKGKRGWSYRSSLFDEKMIDKKDFFAQERPVRLPYSAYVGDELPIQIGTNLQAPSNKKVVLLGDSFRRLWHYFANGQFEEIHSLDLRGYVDGTAAQYIAQLKPDAVVFLVFSDATYKYGKLFDFGIDSLDNSLKLSSEADGGIRISNIEVTASSKSSNKFVPMEGVKLQPGHTYTMEIDEVHLNHSKDQFVEVCLQNLSNNKSVAIRYFKANQKLPQKWVFTVPNNPDDIFGIFFYAGVHGHTQGVTARLEGIVLKEGLS